jgi:PAS domain S-box-containing protein
MVLMKIRLRTLPETWWQIIIITLILGILGLTIWCLSAGITTIFMHLYYFPIVLLAYRYRWKGFLAAMLLSFAYLILVITFEAGQTELFWGAFYRFLAFVGIAAVIAYLSENLAVVQDAFIRNRQFQESVIANANIWITVLAPDGTVLVWNDAAMTISGYRKEDVLGKKTIWKQLYPDKEYRKKVTTDIRLVIQKGAFLENFETLIRCADGTEKTIVWNTRSLRDDSGTTTSFIAIGRDVTAQKAAEFEAGESSRFLSTVLDTLPVPVFFKDAAGRYLGCNLQFEQYTGIQRKGLIGKTAREIVPGDLADRFTAVDRQISDFSALQHYDTRVLHSDGTSHDIIVYKSPFFNKDGSTGGQIGAFLDITERKRAEEALRESESFNRGLIENLPDYLAVYGLDGNIVYVNPASARALGYEAESLVGTSVLSYVAEEYRDMVRSNMATRMNAGETLPYEIDMITKSGIRRSVMVKAAPIHFRTNPAILLLLVDITERKQAEEALRESEEKYRTLIEKANEAVIITQDGVFAFTNRSMSRMLGVPAEDLKGKPFSDYIYPADRNFLKTRYRKRIAGEDVPDFYDFRILGAGGRTRWVSISAAQILWQGRPATLNMMTDITERKMAEEALRESEHRSARLLEAIPDMMFIISKDGIYRDFHVPDSSGLAMPADRIIGTDIRKSGFLKESIEIILQNMRLAMETKNLQLFEYTLEVPRGLRQYEARMVALNDEDILAIVRDITERKVAEAEARRSKQLFSDIISFLPDPTFVIDREGKVLAWNRAIERISGVSAAEMIGRGDHEYSIWQYGKRRPLLIDLVLHPERDAGRLSYTNIREDGSVITAQNEITRPDGKKTLFFLVASPLFDSQGQIAGAIESMRDITQIKETEAELARLNANLESIVRKRTLALKEEVGHRIQAEQNVQAALDYTRSVIEANPDLMVVCAKDGTVLDVNTAAESLTGIPREQLIGSPYSRYFVDDTTPKTVLADLHEKGRLEYTVRLRRADGRITPLSVNATLFQGKDTTDMRIIVSAHDITRQQHDEEAIRASLDEKVILLREIHHRVKNNLQIIISLTNLQMRQTDDPGVKRIMAETQNRVRAMSLVHEKLYRSESLSQIDFADYTRFLATQLFSFYSIDTSRVKLDLTMNRIMVDINTAVPLGLIMNELVSNALKHAFPEGRSGTVTISGWIEDDRITLSVRDTGVGIPPGFDWRNTESLGLRLITSLVDQVNGTVELESDGGTAFTVTLAKKPDQDGTK